MNSSSSQFAGLFGYSKGLTIRNIVLDSSCSITTSFNHLKSEVSTGGIVGSCYAGYGRCVIENSVNMAEVTFSENINGSTLRLGGVAGRLYSSSSESYVKNCANYGSVTFSGTTSNSYIGGIVGSLSGSSSSTAHMYNSLNYGVISSNGSSNGLHIGGIAGATVCASIDNCVSAGKVPFNSKFHAGSIVGKVGPYTHINYCYYESDARVNKPYGTGAPTDATGTPASSSVVDSNLIDILNSYGAGRNWDRWHIDTNSKIHLSKPNENKRTINTFNLTTQPNLDDNRRGFVALPTEQSGGGRTRARSVDTAEITDDQDSSSVTEAEYTVTFDANGGSVSRASQSVTYGETYGELPTPTRTGYTFNGWYTEQSGGAQITEDTNVTIAKDHTLYAQWIANTYKVTFDANGGSALTETMDVTYDSTYGKLPTTTRDGYTFNGWFTSQSGGTQVKETDTVEIISAQTLYAQWTAITYIVTFDANGGSVSRGSQSVIFGSAYGDLPTPTRTGYTFNGWSTAQSGGTKIETWTKVNTASNHFLYAQWAARTYTVSFYGNGGSASTTSKTVTFDSAYDDLPTLSRTGYTFNGWYTAQSGGIQVTSDSTVTIAKDHTLYARWTANTYTVTFDANGGSVSRASQPVTFNSQYGSLPKPSRTGYTFDGWFTEKDGGTQVTSETTVNKENDHTLYAHWTANKYTVTFNGNKGSASAMSKGVTFDEKYGELPSAERTGYTFKGWYTEITNGALIIRNSIVSIAKDHTLYAHWIANRYTVTFVFCNGTEPYEKVLTFDEKIDYPQDPVRDGYTFVRWNNTVANMPAHNLTIMAIWAEDKIISDSKAPSSKKGSTSLVVGFVITFVIMAAIIAVMLFLLLRKKIIGRFIRNVELVQRLISDDNSADKHSRAAEMTNHDLIDDDDTAVVNNKRIMTIIYSDDYKRPTMKNALLEAGLRKSQVDVVCVTCENAVRSIIEEGKLFDEFTEDDAAAIAMYTYDFGPIDFECNPYRVINRSLVGRNYADLQRASGLLYLVMTALRKLPRYTGRTLYRGVRGEVNLGKDHYYRGNVVTWSALSSTSPDPNATRAFLAKGSKNHEVIGTLFIIEDGWGYDIQPYSLFPNEAEILLEPERKFEVVSVDPSLDLTVINLKMLDTPVILPNVFGL